MTVSSYRMINALQQWEKWWQIHFNPSYIRLSNRQHLFNYNIHNHNISLQETDYTIKFLGVHIDNKLTWKSQVDTIINKANEVKGFLS